MLKLEKSKKTREISVRVRRRESVWNRTFFTAFGIAIGIHLGAALLFYIKPLLVDSETILPSFQVGIDQISAPVTATSLEQNERNIRYTIAAFSPSKPQIPSLPNEKPQIVPAMIYSTPDLFRQIEIIPIENPTATYQYPYVPLQISLGGAVTALQLNTANIAYLNYLNVQISSSITIPYRTRFEIRVMNSSGRIYYDSILESSGNVTFDQKARQILQQLSFQPIRGGYDTVGEITLILIDGTPHVF